VCFNIALFSQLFFIVENGLSCVGKALTQKLDLGSGKRYFRQINFLQFEKKNYTEDKVFVP
jgi:hypothetical protein